MRRRSRRHHSPARLANVALAAVRGEKTLSDLAEQFDVNPNLISTWQEQLLKGASEVLSATARSQSAPAAPAVNVKTLHAVVAELTR